jgi:hypothetical protein
MAVLGVGLSGLLAAVAGAVLFARLLRDGSHPVLAGLLGAVCSVADVTSGRTTFALGAVAALGALLLRERRGWAILCAVLCGLLSPVSAAFLGFAAAILVLHRRVGGWTLGIATTVPVIGLNLLFPGGGIQPFSNGSAVPAVAVALTLAVFTTTPMIRTASLLYALAVMVLAVHDDPFGSNVLRLGVLVAASVLLATSTRPLALLLIASVGFMVWQTDPTRGDLRATHTPAMTGLKQELLALGSDRAEVVAGRAHRESYEIAERVPLARGWSRQIDYRDNPLFYEPHLTDQAFVAWLHRRAVDHVAVPRRTQIDFGSKQEAALLTKPVPGLVQVWQDPDWTLFAVTDPTPIAQAPATVVFSRRTSLTLSSDRAASVHVVLRWSHWLNLTGPGCIERDGNETRVRFARPGTVTIGSSYVPGHRC